MKINENSATQSAAIEFDESLFSGSFSLNNSEIIGNNVSFYASIASFYSGEYDISFIYCNISKNYGSSIGSVFAAFHFYGLVFFNHTIFQENKVEINTFIGGAVLILYGDPYVTKLVYKNCSYISNYSSKKGGVFAILFGEVYDFDSYYNLNVANIGGVIFIFEYSVYNLYNGLIMQTQGNYGAVRSAGAAIVNIVNTIFYSNYAEVGACLTLDGFAIELNVFFI